jgi:hypothetical protein
MILANHPCPNCKAVLECEGVAEGDLVDCPQCNITFEVPYLKKPAPIVTPPVIPVIQKKRKKTKPIHWAVGGLFLFAFIYANIDSSEKEQRIAIQQQRPAAVADCRRLTGKVMQITPDGLLLSGSKISYKSLDSDVMYNAGPDFEPVFVNGAVASVDGESWEGVVVHDGVFSYKTVLGAEKRINSYKLVRNYR